MNEDMKVLFFIPTLSSGGAERVLCNLVSELNRQTSLEITVLTLFKDNSDKLPSGVRYDYVFRYKFRGNVQFLKLFSAKFLYRLLIGRRGAYDIIVSYLQGPVMRIVGGCTDNSVKTINWIHNEFHDLSKLAISYRNEDECRASLSRFDATVFVARSAQEAMKQCLPSVVGPGSYVIYNVNDFSKIASQSTECITDVKFDRNNFNIISVGRFVRQKAFDRLIRILAKLRHNGKAVELYLLGDGALKDQYLKEAATLGVERHIHLLGYKQNPFKYVRSADLFVCSSVHEGYSTAVTEALVVGTPVVTTACSGMEELLGSHGEYGIIVQNDEQALYDAVNTVINNTELYDCLKDKSMERGTQLSTADNVTPVIKMFESLVR